MKKTVSIFFIFVLYGCASTTEIVSIGNNTYMVGTSVRGGLESWSEVKARGIRAANTYCDQKGASMTLVGDIKTSGVRGWTPQEAEVRFRCDQK